MSLWTANDDPTGRPKYANNSTVYGVDVNEAVARGRGVSPGWVKVTIGTGGITALTITDGGSGYTNSDVVTIDGKSAPATTNATYGVVTSVSANLAGTVSTISGVNGNVIGTSTTFLTDFANGDSLFVFSNSSSSTVKKINKVVNNTFLNISTTWDFANASASYGVAGIITSVYVTDPGSGFTVDSNVAITSTDGVTAVLVPTLGGRAGRTSYENMVVLQGTMTGDAEDTIFPDS